MNYIIIILFRYMPLDPAYKAGRARHETGHRDPRSAGRGDLVFWTTLIIIIINKIDGSVKLMLFVVIIT